MSNIHDQIEILGMVVSDDVYVAILALGEPKLFLRCSTRIWGGMIGSSKNTSMTWVIWGPGMCVIIKAIQLKHTWWVLVFETSRNMWRIWQVTIPRKLFIMQEISEREEIQGFRDQGSWDQNKLNSESSMYLLWINFKKKFCVESKIQIFLTIVFVYWRNTFYSMINNTSTI